jgi:hypothetical protein
VIIPFFFEPARLNPFQQSDFNGELTQMKCHRSGCQKKGFSRESVSILRQTFFFSWLFEAKGTGSVDIDDITLESVSLEKK